MLSLTSFSWFSSEDSHYFPLKHNVFSSFLSKHILFPNEFHTFSKMSHVSIKVITLNFIKSQLFPTKLYTFAKVSHVCIKVNFIKLDELKVNLFVS